MRARRASPSSACAAPSSASTPGRCRRTRRPGCASEAARVLRAAASSSIPDEGALGRTTSSPRRPRRRVAQLDEPASGDEMRRAGVSGETRLGRRPPRRRRPEARRPRGDRRRRGRRRRAASCTSATPSRTRRRSTAVKAWGGVSLSFNGNGYAIAAAEFAAASPDAEVQAQLAQGVRGRRPGRRRGRRPRLAEAQEGRAARGRARATVGVVAEEREALAEASAAARLSVRGERVARLG